MVSHMAIWRKVRFDILAYYGMQFGMLGIPFMLVPFFGRILGAEGLGLLSQGQAVAGLVTALVEYGFQVSGTRHIAAHRNNSPQLAAVAAAVMSAKLVVAALALLIIPVGGVAIPVFRHHPAFLVFGVLQGIAQGMSFYWLFGGLQRYYLAGGFDFAARVVAAIIIVLIVRTPGDAWIPLAVWAGTQTVGVLAGIGVYIRLFPRYRFRLAHARSALMDGRHVFLGHVIGTFYTGMNPLLLGLVTSVQTVGTFAGGEKLVRAALMPLIPFRQVFFPVVAERISRSPEQGERLLRRMYMLALPVALLGTVLLMGLAEPLTILGLGKGMRESADTVRVMSVLLPLNLTTDMVGSFWMLSMCQDRLCVRATFVVCPIHILLVLGLGWLLPPAYGAATAMVVSQMIAAAIIVYSAWRHHPRRVVSSPVL